MKKNSLILVVVFILGFLTTNTAFAQKFRGLDKSPHDIVYYKTSRKAPPLAKVVYGRPQKKGRTLFGDLIPYGKVWRTGANENTEITFYNDATIGGKSIKAGTYSLFTIPGEKEWTIILNKDIDRWGAYTYNEKNDAVRLKIKVEQTKESLEAFSITFGKDNLYLGWDTTLIAIPIQF